MKKKELIKLAEQIAQAEVDLQESSDPESSKEIKRKIMKMR